MVKGSGHEGLFKNNNTVAISPRDRPLEPQSQNLLRNARNKLAGAD